MTIVILDVVSMSSKPEELPVMLQDGYTAWSIAIAVSLVARRNKSVAQHRNQAPPPHRGL